MSLDETYNRLLEEVELKKSNLIYDYNEYLEDITEMTEDDRDNFKREIYIKEDELFKLDERLKKFEECKRYSEETSRVLESKEETRKTTIPKQKKNGPKPTIYYRINGIEYKTKKKIDILRTLAKILGREKFLEIVDDETFKYKKYFTNRDYCPTSIKEINRNICISSFYIFESIKDILPKTNISMIVSMNDEIILEH